MKVKDANKWLEKVQDIIHSFYAIRSKCHENPDIWEDFADKYELNTENLEFLDKAKNFEITKRADGYYFIESKNSNLVAEITLDEDSVVNPYIIEYGVSGVCSDVYNYGGGYIAEINMTDLESLKSFCKFLVKEL